jgi:hypothetical protein
MIPPCWKVTAIKRHPPARREAKTKEPGACSKTGLFFRRINRIRGRRERLPKINRMPLKVKGPTYSIPDLWATKPKPQIQDVNNKSKSALKACLFMGLFY